MLRGPITLTTDFGTSDHFVGTMKGVILRIAPQVRIVDITHEIAAYGITEAAFVIAQAWKYFPKGSIHVVVVDPGVGSARRPILCETEGQYFIAPDNGVLSGVYESVDPVVRVLSNPAFFLNEVSRTFHGRDVFAPAAAHLATGVDPSEFGDRISDYVQAETRSDGVVLKVDRFGNLITNFPTSVPRISVRIGGETISKTAATYSEAPIGELFLIAGSAGYWEIVVNQGSASERLGVKAGAPIHLETGA